MNYIYICIVLFLTITDAFGQMSIHSLSPLSGPTGSLVTINGVGFDTQPSNNIVNFNGMFTIAENATDTSITVYVPESANTGIISITNLSTHLTASSNLAFDVTFPFCGALDTSSFSGELNLSAEYPYFFKIVDLDNDGRLDILFTSVSYLSIYPNTTTSHNITFGPRMDFYLDNEYPESITINDFNGDGLLDFACTNSYNPTITVFENMSSPGNIAFSSGSDIAISENAYYVASGDMDGDGRQDIVATYRSEGNIVILKNISTSGSIQFAPYVNISATGNGYVNICDMNNDYKPDIVLSNLMSGSIEIHPNSTMLGNISFLPAVTMTSPQYPRMSVCQDMNGDNNPDIIVAGSGFPRNYSIYRHSNNPASLVFSRSDFPNNSYAENIFCGDANGDGKPDLLTADYGTNSVSVYTNISNTGSIVLDNPVIFPALENPSCAAISDMNKDGLPELIYTNHYGGSISIKKNNMLPEAPEICMVTVDSSSENNVIYWDKSLYQKVDSFIILRETTNNVYQKIGEVPFTAPDIFIDTVRNLYFPFTGDPNVGSYRYKLQIKDSCGVYSLPGPYHNTIYIYHIGSTYFWNNYLIENQTIPVPQLSAYFLYRDNNNSGDWTLVAAVSGSQLSINDPDYNLYPNASRRIQTGWSINCNAKESISTSYSNKSRYNLDINNNTSNENVMITVFPNPFQDETTIHFNDDEFVGFSLRLFSITGKEILCIPKINQNTFTFSSQGIQPGIYFLKVLKMDKLISVEKIVITG